jgi:DNA-binding CsgD family transcriptional regulator
MGSLTESGLFVRQVLGARNEDEIARLLRNLGFGRLFWQNWRPNEIDTWDAMPDGFLAHYYGIDADQHCAVARAIHSNWRSFTFKEARDAFGDTDQARQAEQVWRAFGVHDGIIIMSGRAGRMSATILTSALPAEPLFQTYGAALAFAASRLDEILVAKTDVPKISRTLLQLTEKQLEVLRMQIANPTLSFLDQAKRLGISPRMLAKRHQQIAERFGVSSFAGAVAKATARAGGLPSAVASADDKADGLDGEPATPEPGGDPAP